MRLSYPKLPLLARRPPRPKRREALVVPVVVGTLVMAILSGLLIGFGGTLVGGVLIGACVLVAFFFIPLPQIFWGLIIVTFIVVGPVQYFGGIEKIFWFPYLLGFFLFAQTAISLVFAPGQRKSQTDRLYSVELPLILFVVVLLSSTALNQSPVLQVLLAVKEYFFLWGAWFVILGGIVSVRSLDRLWGWLPWFLLLQFPAVIYQRFVIAASRTGGAPWDAVVGLFGGNPATGGASGAMAMCAVTSVAFAFTHWRRGLMSGWKMLMTAVLALATIMLAEVKLAIVLIPLATFLIYGRELASRPLRTFAMLCAALLVSFAVIYAYQTQFTTTALKAGRSLEAYIESATASNLDPDFIDPSILSIGRVAAIKFWWKEQSVDDPLHFTIGNGIGASRHALVSGEVAKRYPFAISRTSVAILLWESGVLGLLAVVTALASGALGAFRLARRTAEGNEAAILQAIGVGLTIALMSLPYGTDFINVPQFQLFVILMLARVAIAARTPAPPRASAGLTPVAGERRLNARATGSRR